MAIDLAKGCQLEVRQVQVRTIADQEEVLAPDFMIGVRCPNRGIYFVDWAASEEDAENSKADFVIQVRLANVRESSDVMIDCDHHGSVPALEVRITDQIIWPEAEREAELAAA